MFDDNSIYSLYDLSKSKFEMPTSDRDFRLNHEKLIKAVKVILYKVNLLQNKFQTRMKDHIGDFETKMLKFESVTKSNLEEVKHFLHTVHTDI